MSEKNYVVFARNFRGFRKIELDLSKIYFLVGDNSSGKSSVLHLVSAVLENELRIAPRLNEDYGVSQYDYFSPYFNNADVTFGLMCNTDDNFIAKAITVKQKNGERPVVTKCSYSTREYSIVFQKYGQSIRRKRMNHSIDSIDEIVEIHNQETGFKVTKKVPPGISISDLGTLLFTLPENEMHEDHGPQAFLGLSAPDFSFVGPIRSLPAKYYDLSRKVSASGLHFATMWHDLERTKLKKFGGLIKSFGDESELFEDLHVKKISSKIPDSPLLVSVVKGGREFMLNQVGVGVSQVVPVLAETIFSAGRKKQRIALFQQPELHLHPIAQSALGSFFFAASKDGFRAILETHSSFLIDRFRADIRANQKTLKVNAEILYCVNSSSGNSTISIPISENGDMVGAPDEYHAFFVDEMIRTMF